VPKSSSKLITILYWVIYTTEIPNKPAIVVFYLTPMALVVKSIKPHMVGFYALKHMSISA
tara:strand:- start:2599 stop:2778 length:180 start_codon:yes stop_codon:yes gene_type:complete